MIRRLAGVVRRVAAPDYGGVAVGRAPGGAQDRFSCSLGNLLLGNARVAGALECAMAPARFAVQEDCRILVAGAPVEVRIGGQRRPRWEVVAVPAGSELELRPTGVGCRSYLCVAGGLGEMETSGAQQWPLRAVREGCAPQLGVKPVVRDRRWEPEPGELRVLPGPEFHPGIAAVLEKSRWIVSRQSSGMGVILEGNSLGLESYDLLSAPVQDGTVQATARGLVALLRERGTLGGYPRVATVIDCDVDRLAQMLPGNRLRLRLVSRDEAASWCRFQEEALRRAVGE